MNIREKHTTILRDAQAITERAKAAGRDLTAAERTEVTTLLKKADEIAEQLDRVAAGRELLDTLAASGQANRWRYAAGEVGDDFGPGWGIVGKGFLQLKSGAGAAAGRLMRQIATDETGRKSLIGSGSTSTGVQLDPNPIAEGRPAGSLLDLLPAVRRTTPAYRWMRQTTRTNAAAVVSPGSAKPVSVYTLTSVDGSLDVVAHLSEAIDSYQLGDNAGLSAFVEAELQYGLAAAVETLALTTIAADPDITSQAFVTDTLTTTRKAVTTIETAGLTAAYFAMHPADWEAIELIKASGTGDYQLNPSLPVDRAARRLWGVPVAVTVSAPPKTGYLLSTDAVQLSTDSIVSLRWAEMSDDFSKNQVRARCEGRFAIDVQRPLGVVSIALTDDDESS